MNKKTISTIGIVIVFLLTVYQLTKDQELAKLGAVLGDYSRVDKIQILIEDSRKIEINNNDKEMLESFKDNLFPFVLISDRQNKKKYKGNLGEKVYDIDFYVGNKVVFKEAIYELSDEFQATTENSFMIGDKHYIAKWKKNFVKLKMSDPNSFINVMD
ncbi:hypothetical protein [Sporosarcina highlanderae]|uniref:Uncharacterized protein n=1 Tax=Sporosarcina highlanderae TaxID=3035916 RepID=A0ABT8JM01_9BACL|nr:hypothetical protein [Sporosarcina highlanderae]MDN4606183.1 hypothetical protein [Sporosarcina highlanderae]